MLNVHALPSRPSAHANPHACGSGADASTDPAGFSSMLRYTQQSAAPASPKAVAPKPESAAPERPVHEADADTDAGTARAADADATPAPDAAPPEGAVDRARVAMKPMVRDVTELAEAKPEARPADAESTHEIAVADAKAADNVPASVPAPPIALDPAIAQWLAAQQPAPRTTKPAAADLPTTLPAPALPAPALRATGARPEAPAEAGDTTAHSLLAAETVAPATAFAAVLAEEQRDTDRTPARHADMRTETRADAISASAFSPASTLLHAATAPAALTVAAPIDSPDFAQALGVQMSVLAREGIQHAELHLNPAEMGPVSVQIVMDGTQARIDFGADMAATRQAIEAGLPELASALRDAGFTLAGGGVSQHSGRRPSGGRGDPGDARPAMRRVGDEAITRVSAAAQRAVTRGALDLYA